MLRPLGSIFLAVTVLLANAYCACVPVAGGSTWSPEARVEKPAHPGCHGHGGEQEEQPDDRQHNCGHCTGTVSADTSSGKTMMPSDLSPLCCGAPVFTFIGSITNSTGHAFDHSGPSPPVPPPTLLSLGCSLTI